MSTPALGRREQNKLEKRGRIIAASRALFQAKGFEATTTHEIAEAAGVASGTVFTYVASKEELLILVFHDEMMGIVQTAYSKAQSARTLTDQSLIFFETIVAYHERNLPLAQLLMRQLGYVGNRDQRDLVDELMTALLRNLAKLVEAAKTRGEVAQSRPAISAARGLFAIYYLHLGGLLNGYIDRTQFDRILRTDLETLQLGLAAD